MCGNKTAMRGLEMARIIDYEARNVVGDKLRQYRIERNMSQQDMSERLETYAIYICRNSVSRIEKHKRTVTDYELQAMAKVLEVNISDLFEKSTERQSADADKKYSNH